MWKGSTPKLPQTPCCDLGDRNRCLDKCQAEPFQRHPPNTITTTTTDTPGWFQEGGIWMCGCMCSWHLLFHFVDVWLCCWQTSVAHASHAVLKRNSEMGGGWWKCQPWSDFPARLQRAAVITSRWNTQFHSFHLIPKWLPPLHLTPLIQTLSCMQN